MRNFAVAAMAAALTPGRRIAGEEGDVGETEVAMRPLPAAADVAAVDGRRAADAGDDEASEASDLPDDDLDDLDNLDEAADFADLYEEPDDDGETTRTARAASGVRVLFAPALTDTTDAAVVAAKGARALAPPPLPPLLVPRLPPRLPLMSPLPSSSSKSMRSLQAAELACAAASKAATMRPHTKHRTCR